MRLLDQKTKQIYGLVQWLPTINMGLFEDVNRQGWYVIITHSEILSSKYLVLGAITANDCLAERNT